MLLELDRISAGYGDLKVLFDVSLHIKEGEVVSLVGPNGAGKTTILNIISGFVPVTSGGVVYQGTDLTKVKTSQRANLGIAHIPQGRGVLETLSIADNLLLGAYNKHSHARQNENMAKQLDRFPILKERAKKPAGSLSGGQQQILAIARAMMMEPKLLILDEPSLGLAPIVVKEMFSIIADVSKQGMSILIVEQNLVQALSVANRGYVLETGRVAMEGKAEELLENESIKRTYLGI
ncbi:ABC transporter ATP-binding protein [Oscillospiraceae bacterium MB08-C2-2]|nr:ABC transporter ATP-binding protein [Oscillospiraceae bacterium MB08-C2-2]